MSTPTPISGSRLLPVPPRPNADADDLDVARRRMRHLAPWLVEPLPAMHAAMGHAGEPKTSGEQSRDE